VNRSRMTKAVVATAYGGPEVLSVINTPVARPGPGEALISVRAAGTNPIDYKLYSGALGRDSARLPRPRQDRPGALGVKVAGVGLGGRTAARSGRRRTQGEHAVWLKIDS
jgi:NADPH:quinone reductase